MVFVIIAIEVIALAFIVYGWTHEKEFIAAEYRLGIRKLKANEDIVYIRRERVNKYK